MGTSTFFLRNNDLGRPLHRMNKKELEKLNNLSPYDKDTRCLGWNVPLELHNGNVYILVFWKGGLMKLEDAPKILNKKDYDKYRRQNNKLYKWTLLKKLAVNEIAYLDKEFKKSKNKTF